MAEEINEEEKIAGLHRKPNGFGKLFKAFMIAGGIAVLGGGACQIVKQAEEKKAEKKKTEAKAVWKDAYSDADSLSITNDGKGDKFYAVKKMNKEKIAELEAKRKAILDKANKEFTKALKARDTEGMKKAVEAGADNINTPNDKGQTPLMQLVKEAESAKAYQAARYLISINVDVNAKDKDGATAEDYAMMHKTLKGQTLKREIIEKKNAEVNRGGNSKELEETEAQINKEKGKYYEVSVDKSEYKYSADGYREIGDAWEGFGSGHRDLTDLDKAKIYKLLQFQDKYLK